MKQALRSPLTVLVVLAGIAGVLLVLYAWRLPPFASAVETTDNAYVRGQVTVLSPQLSGYVTAVAVQDYQRVAAGDLIVQLDDRAYQEKLKQAQATLASHEAALASSEQDRLSAEARILSSRAQLSSAQAALVAAEANAARMESLLTRGAAAASTAEQARSTLEQARGAVQQAEAALAVAQQDLQGIAVARHGLAAAVASAEAAVRLAEIDLQNTRVLAPEDGRLGEVGVRLGQYVSAGMQLGAIVPDRKWVVANFKETQLYGMAVGQPVRFTVDALRHAELTGRVEGFSPATGSEFSVIKADNATGNFTKVAQRLPVRIAIDPGQPLTAQLAPGMSVVVSIDTAARAQDGLELASGRSGDPAN